MMGSIQSSSGDGAVRMTKDRRVDNPDIRRKICLATRNALTLNGTGYMTRLVRQLGKYKVSLAGIRRKKNIVVSGNMDKKNRVGRSVFIFYFFTMVLISTLSYCTRFCLCCFLVTLYFDMFCYRKNDLDDDKQLELQ